MGHSGISRLRETNSSGNHATSPGEVVDIRKQWQDDEPYTWARIPIVFLKLTQRNLNDKKAAPHKHIAEPIGPKTTLRNKSTCTWLGWAPRQPRETNGEISSAPATIDIKTTPSVAATFWQEGLWTQNDEHDVVRSTTLSPSSKASGIGNAPTIAAAAKDPAKSGLRSASPSRESKRGPRNDCRCSARTAGRPLEVMATTY